MSRQTRTQVFSKYQLGEIISWGSYRIISKPDCSIDNLPQDVMFLNIKEMEWAEMFIAR